jgi:hypothetical protein
MIGILLEDAYYGRTWQLLFNAFLGEIIICRLEVDGGRIWIRKLNHSHSFSIIQVGNHN